MPLDARQSSLLSSLHEMNERSLCAPYAPIKELLDNDTIRDIQAIQQVARTLRGAHGMPVVSHLQAPLVLLVIRTHERWGVK